LIPTGVYCQLGPFLCFPKKYKYMYLYTMTIWENYDIFHSGLVKGSCNQFAFTLQCPLTCAKHAYVTYRDIRDVKHFKNRTVIAIKAPPETRLEVPDPKEVLIMLSS